MIDIMMIIGLALRKYSFIALVFTPLLLAGQNWRIINPSYKYNYQHDTANYIASTIYVDSIDVIEGDSVFYLNRIMAPCDTCTSLPWGPDNYYLKNQPQFLQRMMTRLEDNTWKFHDTAIFYIKPKTSVGGSWIFDSSLMIIAQVENKYLDTAFNIQDSMKRIVLSNGREIILSKNFGILEYEPPDGINLTLEGIEGPGLGTQVPKFHDFFDFQVGDIFQYQISAGWATGIGYEAIDTYEKVTILEKIESTDSLHYDIHKIGRTVHWDTNFPYDTSYFNEFVSITYIDSTDHACNRYQNEKVNRPLGFYDDFPHFTKMILKRENDTMMVREEGDYQTYWGSVFTYHNYPDTSLHADLLEVCCADQFVRTYKTGLGETFYFLWIFEIEESKELIGYIKNGDTTGVIIDDSILTSTIEAGSRAKSFKLYPNPADDYFIISYSEIPERSILSIYTISGVPVKSIQLGKTTQNQRIDVPDINPGLYVIVLRNSKGNYYNKLIIK
jgi:hypothetical protein